MNSTNKEKTTILKPFPFKEDEKYLLKLKYGEYVVAFWSCGEFILDYELNCSTEYIEEEIESIVSLKELGL